MPELPEVETIRRALAPIDGRTISNVHLRRDDVVDGLPSKRSDQPEALLVGGVVALRQRHGKQLAIVTRDGRAACIQLGMSGQVLRGPSKGEPNPGRHDHVVWTLDDGSTMTFRDPRRFGGITLFRRDADLRKRWAELGPDALAVTAADLARATSGSDRAVKAVLLDQDRIAGVGNIYADEALFEAQIRPTKRATLLKPSDHDRLAEAIRQVLRHAVDARGSSLRDYVQPDGARGEAVALHRVYGRGGEPCVRCGATLKRVTLAQRTTVYCPQCQR